jgi:hypothetical protein
MVGFVANHTSAGGVISLTVNHVDDQSNLTAQADVARVTDLGFDSATFPNVANVPIAGYGMLLFTRPGASTGINVNANVIPQIDPTTLRSITIQYQYDVLAQNVVGGCVTVGCGNLWGTVAFNFTGGQFIANSPLNPSLFSFFVEGDFADAPEPVTLGVTGFALLALVAYKVSRASKV